MAAEGRREPVFVVAGPTASGKTSVAIELAAELDGEVVGADSMQVYRYLDIGTDKPTADELGGVAHHMIDLVDPDEEYDAARFVDDADAAIADVQRRGRRAIVGLMKTRTRSLAVAGPADSHTISSVRLPVSKSFVRRTPVARNRPNRDAGMSTSSVRPPGTGVVISVRAFSTTGRSVSSTSREIWGTARTVIVCPSSSAVQRMPSPSPTSISAGMRVLG